VLKIQNHRLVGDQVTFRQTPNTGGAMQPRYLVMHYTAGRSLESSVESLCTRKPQGNASAHVVLGRDGRIVQLAAFNVVTWHAGISHWNGLTGLNQHAVGIEMDNAGRLHREGDRYVAWFGKSYPGDEVLLAEHRHGGGTQPWHTFSEVQIERALELSDALVAHYGLEDLLGHEDVAPGRKTDPGPAFPLQAVRSRVMGRGEDAPRRLIVTASALNIRGGPGANYDKVAPALRRGTELLLLEPRDRWSLVAVVGITDVEGWVCNDFIEALAPPRAATAPRTRGMPAAPASAPVLSRAERASPPAAKRAGAKRPAARKAAARKAAPRPAAGKTASGRTAAKKTAARRSATEKAAARKTATRKAAAGKAGRSTGR
jgi:N-acetylmuramoyl-L-alanine amidase